MSRFKSPYLVKISSTFKTLLETPAFSSAASLCFWTQERVLREWLRRLSLISDRAGRSHAAPTYRRDCCEPTSGFIRSTGPLAHEWVPSLEWYPLPIHCVLSDSTSPQVYRPITHRATGPCVYSNKTGNWQPVVRYFKALPRNWGVELLQHITTNSGLLQLWTRIRRENVSLYWRRKIYTWTFIMKRE